MKTRRSRASAGTCREGDRGRGAGDPARGKPRGGRTHVRDGRDGAFRLARLVVRRDARGRGRGRVKRVERNFHVRRIPATVSRVRCDSKRTGPRGVRRGVASGRQPPPPARARRLRPRASPTPRRRECASAAASERLLSRDKNRTRDGLEVIFSRVARRTRLGTEFREDHFVWRPVRKSFERNSPGIKTQISHFDPPFNLLRSASPLAIRSARFVPTDVIRACKRVPCKTLSCSRL